MERFATQDDVVALTSVRPWQAPHPDQDNTTTSSDDNNNNSNSHGDSLAFPFPCDAHLNARVAIWHGPIWKIQADAIVNSTSESLQEMTGLCRKIIDAAGKEFWTECESAGFCRTGEAVVTRGCRLPAQKIIHTVGPRYNTKYHNAAEHALHMCYRSVLCAAVEHKLRSVVVPCIYTKRKAYPRDEAAHIAARTVRRFLEHYRNDFDLVVFCVDTLEDQMSYEALLPLYFPRSQEEETRSKQLLESRDLGNAYGEPIIGERQIRIGGLVGNATDGTCNQLEEQGDGDGEDDEDTAVQRFCEMSADPDVERLETLKQLQSDRQRHAQRQKQKRQQQRQQTDFQDFHKMRFLYTAGVDHAGAPVVVYMASRLPIADVDLDRVMLFIIQSLDLMADKKYSVLYIHEDANGETQVNSSWLKRLFKLFSSKYQDNLQFFYMYEPSMWLKLLVLVAKGFVSHAFYKKIVYLASASDLKHVASELDLPSHMCPPQEQKQAIPRENNNGNSTSVETTPGHAAVLQFFGRKAATIM